MRERSAQNVNGLTPKKNTNKGSPSFTDNHLTNITPNTNIRAKAKTDYYNILRWLVRSLRTSNAASGYYTLWLNDFIVVNECKCTPRPCLMRMHISQMSKRTLSNIYVQRAAHRRRYYSTRHTTTATNAALANSTYTHIHRHSPRSPPASIALRCARHDVMECLRA